MCRHSRLIYNHYTHKAVRVSCGHCDECRQEKACARANRIRNNSMFGEIALFVTLTYSPEFIPYILRSEINDDYKINIYRDASVRLYRGKEKVTRKRVLLDSAFILDKVDFSDVPYPRKSPKDYIGVLYFKDCQDFIKRLRINLLRDYPDDKIKITFYQCGEYGASSKRPHFHLLIFVRRDYEEKVRLSINKSWLYADRHRTEKYTEIAKDAASYVASYVNSHMPVDSVLALDVFKQKHSYSKGFGVRLECFSLVSILDKINRQDLRYSFTKMVEGVPCINTLPVPKYVINRYFPQFTGYFLFAPDEIRQLLLRTDELCDAVQSRSYQLTFNSIDRHRLAVRFRNIYLKFHDELGWSYEQFHIDYPLLYCKAWSLYGSTVLKDSYDEIQNIDDLYGFYENANDLVNGNVQSDLSLFDNGRFVLNPNDRPLVVRKSSNLLSLFYKLDKSRKVVNYAMSNSGHYV